jgi:NADH:ubiquinone oxidoreductase subunit 4 (subunit M)
MYFRKEDPNQVTASPVISLSPAIGLVLIILLILVLGVYPSAILGPLSHYFSSGATHVAAAF